MCDCLDPETFFFLINFFIKQTLLQKQTQRRNHTALRLLPRLTAVSSLGDAPCCSSKLMMCVCPCCAAWCRGV